MEITWEKIGEDDFSAIPESGVMLRVEKLDRNWWWAVFYDNLRETIDCWYKNNLGTSEEDAKTKSIEAYKKIKNAH